MNYSQRKGYDFPLKAILPGRNWPEYQRGRELTLYVFQWTPEYASAEKMLVTDCTGKEVAVRFSPADQRSPQYLRNLINSIDQALKVAKIRSRGCATGDHKISDYASIRNESFVEWRHQWEIPPGWTGYSPSLAEESQFIYPPNAAGFNGAGHQSPFEFYSTVSHKVLLGCVGVVLIALFFILLKFL